MGDWKILGIEQPKAELFKRKIQSTNNPYFHFIRLNLEDVEALNTLFEKEKFDVVCHLAAQAGVRYSLEIPKLILKVISLDF